jgi:enamine deaminase RidA (YjgF/YER057c/UK114 family)
VSDRGDDNGGGSRIDDRLAALGIVLPPVFRPVGNYLGCSVVGDMLYVGGHGPAGADGVIRGKVGGEVSLERGKEAARLTALSMLATVEAELGSLDRIRQIVKVFGMVNCAPGFNRTPEVIDGCSDVLVAIFGDAGRHTRSAVGMAELPFDISVEIEMIAQLRPPS